MEDKQPYTMTLSLNVLNHLGINLYSNAPAVISEVVANSWDADAKLVEINIDSKNKKITITDTGHGMTRQEANEKYLNVGYRRRDEEGGKTTPEGRTPMGRKGIGKLSLFSIAKEIELFTVKDGEKNAFKMVIEDIEKAIKGEDEKEDGSKSGDYHPTPIPEELVGIEKGTEIIISRFKKNIKRTPRSLRTLLARRFSILGAKNNFNIIVNGKPVGITDRGYFHKIKDLWWYGDESAEYKGYCKKLENDERRDNVIKTNLRGIDLKVSGWIGAVASAGELKEKYENLNKIVVMVRGKLAQEDILEDINEGRLFSKYILGEIHADFLDVDEGDYEDCATTSRQEIKKDDERYKALREFIRKEITHIGNVWTKLRDTEGTKKAQEIPAIKEWYSNLGIDHKKMARSLFGKINQITTDSEEEKRNLFKYSVIAFENLKYKEQLSALENITPQNFGALASIFKSIDDIEATLYHQITKIRIEAIENLYKKVDQNEKEKVIQKHLFDHLWLLDPSWERATETPQMEKAVKSEFKKIDAKLTVAEKRARLDLKYKKTTGIHVIIELKRARAAVSSEEISKQLRKYVNTLRKLLAAVDRGHEPIEAVCVVGRELKDWVNDEQKNRSKRSLKEFGIRVLFYQELIENAYSAYQEYIAARKEVSKLFELIQSIDTGEIFGSQ